MKPATMQMSMVMAKLKAPSRASSGLCTLAAIDMARMGPIMGEMSMLATIVGAELTPRPTAASTAAHHRAGECCTRNVRHSKALQCMCAGKALQAQSRRNLYTSVCAGQC